MPWLGPRPRCALTWILVCLTLSISGCATSPPEVVYRDKVITILPDRSYTTQEPMPLLGGPTNEDLIQVWQQTQKALTTCNGRADALAHWMDDPQTTGPSVAPSQSGVGADDHPR